MPKRAAGQKRTTPVRILVIAVAVVAVGVAFLGIKWQIGDMLAKLTSQADEQATAVADTALSFAPSDPYASDLRAAIGEDATSADTRSAVEIAEETVRLAPADHRWRIALARALSDDGQMDRAEAEYKRAVSLAPTYSVCHWYYGNFLLRQGRRDDAIAELKAAAADNWDYRGQVLSLLWDFTGQDIGILESVAGDGVDNVAQLAQFVGGRGHAAEALRIWDRLSDSDKQSRGFVLRSLAQGLFEQKHFAEALEFSRQLGGDPDAKFEAVTNWSFESSIEPSPNSRFGWNINRTEPKLDIAIDSRVRHEGTRSLRLTFKGASKPELSNTEQTIAVAPNTRYRLTFWLRTENLKAPAGPQIGVATGLEYNYLARTAPFDNGTHDWRQVDLIFTTPADASGITIRTIRAGCGGDDCPITGTIWYDEFVLTRL